MTTQRRDGCDTPFGAWIRNQPQLDSKHHRMSVMDTDWWIHQYRSHVDRIGERRIDSIMCVELKTFEADLRYSQRDTLRLVAATYRKINYTKDGKCKTIRLDMGNEIRLVRMYGYFVLRLEKDSPAKGWIEWDGRKIGVEKLIQVLRFDCDPRTLNGRSERRHHTHGSAQSQPDLFDEK